MSEISWLASASSMPLPKVIVFAPKSKAMAPGGRASVFLKFRPKTQVTNIERAKVLGYTQAEGGFFRDRQSDETSSKSQPVAVLRNQ
ncbi:MAG TPA: hypothetical protein VIL63_11130 [Terriglobales bacterium]